MLVLGDPETLPKWQDSDILLVAEASREPYISIFLLCEYVNQQ